MSDCAATATTAELKEQATVNARAGHLQQAVREFGEALNQWTVDDGNDVRSACLQNRGLCYQKMEQLEDAKADFSAAVEIDPSSPAPYVNRGGVLFLLGQSSAALADYQRYLDLDPEDELGMHEAVLAHITLCAPPDDYAGQEQAFEEETSADLENASLLGSDGEANTGSQSLRRGRSIPQRTIGPTDAWLNGTNIPKPRRWERRQTEGPRPQPTRSFDIVRTTSEVSRHWHKQAAVCGALAAVAIAALVIFSLT